MFAVTTASHIADLVTLGAAGWSAKVVPAHSPRQFTSGVNGIPLRQEPSREVPSAGEPSPAWATSGVP